MTIPEQLPCPGEDHGGDVLAVHESVVVSERLKATTCAWCGEQVLYAGVGRPPKYCRVAHRKRASELRTAQRRAGRPVAEGGRTTEPVREVVERTETVTRTTVRRGPAKLRLPEDIYEWQHALRALRGAVEAGQLAGFHEVLVCDLEATVGVVRERQEQIAQRLAGTVPASRPPRL